MIKKHFTDGLISLAILLSLFRTDLSGINDFINYPEVQDIILGQTAAYLPTSFHHSPQTLINSRKYLEFENDAFAAIYNNINNLPLFREQSQNHIEAFLVSAGLPSQVTEQFQASEASPTETNTQPDVNETTAVRNNTSSPTLPIESAGTSNNLILIPLSEIGNSDSDSSETPSGTNGNVDISLPLNNPFPGCDLSDEDLRLIDVLWQQDVDLGCGKEAFDQNLRLELEKERQLENLKQQEKIQAQRLAAEKEEQERKESANKWLKENFTRDGETGEWVCLQNATIGNLNDVGLLTDSQTPDSEWTLEQALEYISVNGGQDFVPNPGPEESLNVQTVPSCSIDQPVTGHNQINPVPSAHNSQLYSQQDSLEDHWNGLVDYLNLTVTPPTLDNAAPPVPQTAETEGSLLLESQFSAHNNDQFVDLDGSQFVNNTDDIGNYGGPVDQSQYLLQNATLPVSCGVDLASELNVLTPIVTNMTSEPIPTPEEPVMDWSSLNFFNNLTSLPGEGGNDLDLVNIFSDVNTDTLPQTFNEVNTDTVSQTFNDVDTGHLPQTSNGINLAESMDTLQMLSDDLNASLASDSPPQELVDVFDGLEGATGGLELSNTDFDLSHGDLDLNGNRFDVNDGHLSYSKMSRLSESSSDSGMGHNFSSPDPSPSTSSAASPASSHGGNRTASNHTEHGSQSHRVQTVPHIAHNHTYNTPPGQVPREVKKYAHKEPSRKGPQSRDVKRATEMKIPFSVPEIINSPVETFNEMLTKHKLTDPQLALIRDIRRRGKNKVAAQNCRKRKVGVIVTLSDEMTDLQKMRDRLLEERAQMEQEQRRMKEKFSHMYANIFQSLRNDQGEPYDPNLYSLQQSSDGNVFLVPRNLDNSRNRSSTGNTNTAAAGRSSTKDRPSEGTSSRKRKAYDP